MAKVNVQLLQGIASGAVQRVSQKDGKPLVEAGLIEVNTQDVIEGLALVRLTDAGLTMVAPKTIAPASNGSKYEVISGAALPPSKRGNKGGGGAPVQYPFDSMEIGQSFFVPVSEKHPDPVKTLGSTVSSANMRYAEDTGEKKTVTRAKRGPKNRAVLNPDGSKQMETVEVPVYKHTRRFSIRPVKAGVVYGNWTAPADGALIARVNLKDAE